MKYERLIERTIYRADGTETELLGSLVANNRAEAMAMLESIGEKDSDSFAHGSGHHRSGSWFKGNYWVIESCRVHPDFGRCYTEFRYRLLRPRWPQAQPVDQPHSAVA